MAKILRHLLVLLINVLRVSGLPIAKPLTHKAKEARMISSLELYSEPEIPSSFEHSLRRTFVGAARFDERIIEYPCFSSFLHESGPELDILDLGMTLNNPTVSSDLSKSAKSITFLNPNPDTQIHVDIPNFVRKDRMHAVPDFRHQFDLVTSLSTIEHMGWSNRQYGDRTPAFLRRPSTVNLELFLWFARYCLKPAGQFFVSFPVGRSMRNLHPRSLRWASQTFSRDQVLFALEEAEALGFKAGFSGFYIKAGDFVPGGLETAEMWELRYGRGAPAATAVGFFWGTLDLEKAGAQNVSRAGERAPRKRTG